MEQASKVASRFEAQHQQNLSMQAAERNQAASAQPSTSAFEDAAVRLANKIKESQKSSDAKEKRTKKESDGGSGWWSGRKSGGHSDNSQEPKYVVYSTSFFSKVLPVTTELCTILCKACSPF